MKPVTSLAAAAGALLLAAWPAAATILTTTYTGTLSYGADDLGLFGAAGGNLAGLSFMAIYRTDTAAAGAFSTTSADVSYTSGGTADGFTSPTSAILTINGNSVAIAGLNFGQMYRTDNLFGRDQIYSRAIDDDANFLTTLQNSIYSDIHDFIAPADYQLPIDYTIQAGDTAYGFFEKYDHTTSASTYLLFSNVRVIQEGPRIDTGGGVPEPASWALLIIGFAGTGVMVRHARRSVIAEA